MHNHHSHLNRIIKSFFSIPPRYFSIFRLWAAYNIFSFQKVYSNILLFYFSTQTNSTETFLLYLQNDQKFSSESTSYHKLARTSSSQFTVSPNWLSRLDADEGQVAYSCTGSSSRQLVPASQSVVQSAQRQLRLLPAPGHFFTPLSEKNYGRARVSAAVYSVARYTSQVACIYLYVHLYIYLHRLGSV